MNHTEFFSRLSQGDIREVYLFTGAENFVKREALQKLRAALLPAGLEALNETVLEGVSAGRIIEASETLPVMCDRRLVVVRDWAPLTTENAKDRDAEIKRIIDWTSVKNDSCTLVFYLRGELPSNKEKTSGKDKSSRKEKTSAKNIINEFVAHVCRVDFNQLSDVEIIRWIASHLKPYRKKMPESAAHQLIFTAGRDLTQLDGELSKLVAYSGDRANIDEADIEAVVSPSLEYGAFDMLNHLFDGDSPGAYRLLELMLERGANRVAIIASIASQLRGMSFIAAGLENGRSADETGRQLRLHPYAARAMAPKARRYPSAALEEMYIAAVDTEYAVKSGQMRDSAALDRLFIKISALPAKNTQPAWRRPRQR